MRCSSLLQMSAARLRILHPAHWGLSYAVTPRTAAPAATVVNTHTHIDLLRRHTDNPVHRVRKLPFSSQAMHESSSLHSSNFPFSQIIHSVFITTCSCSLCPTDDSGVIPEIVILIWPYTNWGLNYFLTNDCGNYLCFSLCSSCERLCSQPHADRGKSFREVVAALV